MRYIYIINIDSKYSTDGYRYSVNGVYEQKFPAYTSYKVAEQNLEKFMHERCISNNISNNGTELYANYRKIVSGDYSRNELEQLKYQNVVKNYALYEMKLYSTDESGNVTEILSQCGITRYRTE